MKDRKLLGTIGEDFAESLLFADGYTILARNYRTVFGEVDIVCERRNVICFVEVKTRECEEFGEPYEAVDKDKMQRIRKSAEYYMAEHYDIEGGTLPDVRFKVLELMVREMDDDLISM